MMNNEEKVIANEVDSFDGAVLVRNDCLLDQAEAEARPLWIAACIGCGLLSVALLLVAWTLMPAVVPSMNTSVVPAEIKQLAIGILVVPFFLLGFLGFLPDIRAVFVNKIMKKKVDAASGVYRCTESFTLPGYTWNGEKDGKQNQYEVIEGYLYEGVGPAIMTNGAVRLVNRKGWVEVSSECFGKHFREVEEDELY